MAVDIDSLPSPDQIEAMYPHSSVADSLPSPAEIDAMGKNPSTGEALLRGGVQGVSFGFAPAVTGAAETAYDALTGDTPENKGIVEQYRTNRDASQAAYDAAQKAHPAAFMTGELGGALGTSFIPGLGVLNAGKDAKLLELAAKGAIQGGLFGAGNSRADLTKGEVGQFAKDVGYGAGAGGATAGAFGTAANLAVPEASLVTRTLAKGALGAGTGAIGAEVLTGGEATPEQLLTGAGLGVAATAAKNAGQHILENTEIGQNLAKKFTYGGEGVSLQSKKDYDRLANKNEEIAQKVANSTKDIETSVKAPAEEKIKNAFSQTLKDIGTQRDLKSQELTDFIANNLDNFGQKIGEMEQDAQERGKEIPLFDILSAAKSHFDGLNPTTAAGEKAQENLSQLFFENMYKEGDPLKIKTTKLLDASGNPISASTQVSGKGALASLPEIDQATGRVVGLNPDSITPSGASVKVSNPALNAESGLPEELGGASTGSQSQVQTQNYTPLNPIQSTDVQSAKKLLQATGEAAGNPDNKGAVQAAAGQAYGQLKQAVNTAMGDNYVDAKAKYSALKNVLEAAGVKNISEDSITKKNVTPDQFQKVFSKLKSAFQDRDFKTYNEMFDNLAIVAPDQASAWKQGIESLAQQEGSISAAKNQGALEQAAILQKLGLGPDLAPQVGQVNDINGILNTAGSLDASQPLNSQGSLLPSQTTRNFVSDIGNTERTAPFGRAQDVQNTINAIGKYDQPTASLLNTEGAANADQMRALNKYNIKGHGGLWSAVAGTGAKVSGDVANTAGLLKNAAGNAIDTGINTAVNAGRKAIGIGINPDRLTMISDLLRTKPEVFGQYADQLQRAAARGPAALSATNFILSQQHPEFRRKIEGIDSHSSEYLRNQ